MTRTRRAALAAALILGACAASAGEREIEVGFEAFGYRTAATPLNPDNVLGLDDVEGLARAALSWKEVHGPARVVFRGYVERRLGHGADETEWTVRQAYGQYGWGPGLSLRMGKQRIAWGSGLVWNPTNRAEPPRNPFNPASSRRACSRHAWTGSPPRGSASSCSRRRAARAWTGSCRSRHPGGRDAAPAPCERALPGEADRPRPRPLRRQEPAKPRRARRGPRAPRGTRLGSCRDVAVPGL